MPTNYKQAFCKSEPQGKPLIESRLFVSQRGMANKIGPIMTFRIIYLITWISFDLGQINGSPRANLIITGTTMRPKFKRQEGKMSLECPVDHPWAFDLGFKCCKTYKGANLDQELEFNDPSSSCENDDWIPCPNLERLCRSRVNPVTCPASHPLGLIEAGCCQSIVSRYDPDANPPCFGDILNPFSSPTCCSNLSRVDECTDRRQKCFSLEVGLVKDSPLILEETTLYGTLYARYALTNSPCDELSKTYWASTNSGRYFIIDMGYHFIPYQVILRNSRNDGHGDRGTREFKIYGSDMKPPIGEQTWPEWIEIAQASFPDPRPFGRCDVPLTMLPINTTRWLRYFKFQVLSHYGYGATLQFIRID